MIAVVTGATSGIGRAAAEALLARGDTVVGVGRNSAALAQLSTHPRFVSVECDIADTHDLVEQLLGVVAPLGTVDLLVNNAGVAEARTIPETTPEFFAATMNVNLAAPAAAIHVLWPYLTAAHGCIINVSSLAQLDPFPGFFAYAASKAGLHLLTVVATAEGAAQGIRSFTLAPGVVDTPLHRSMMPESIPPVNGIASVLTAADVATAICDIADGTYDSHNGWVLAMPAPAARDAITTWVETHPGGGVRILQ